MKDTHRFSISLRQRAALILTLITLLVVSAGGVSLWFAISVQRSLQAMRESNRIAIRISDMQLAWLNVVSVLDTFSLTRPTPEAKQALDSQLDLLTNELGEVDALSFGLTPETIAKNKEITRALRQTGTDLTVLSNEIYTLANQSRWGTALQRRQSGLANLQASLVENLNQLNTNIQADLDAQLAEVQRLQTISLVVLGILAVITLILAALVARMAQRRMLEPLTRIRTDVQRIQRGDFSPVVPFEWKDEIGDLSRAIAVMNDWLRESNEKLEERVAERTRDLERRTVQLQVAAQVARDIAAASGAGSAIQAASYNVRTQPDADLQARAGAMEHLMYDAVNLIRDRFGFYHAGIFLTDERQEYVVLRAATGEAGREMIRSGHRLKIGQTGLVGYAAQRGEARIALEVGQDKEHFKNPLLPETRSEAALPLKTGGFEPGSRTSSERIIGVLDVQSQSPAAFDAESMAVLQVIADQLATAIQNTRLVQEIQGNLRELETAYGSYDRQAWGQFLRTRLISGYEFDGLNTTPITTEQAAEQVPAASLPSADGKAASRPLSVPLRVRGERIGTLDVWPQEEELSEAEVYLLATISSRLSQILESARLFEESQARVAQEETLNRLTAAISSSLDTDGVLRSTVNELSKLPLLTEASVYLGVPQRPAVGERSTPDYRSQTGNSPPDGIETEQSSADDDGSTGGGNGHRA
jgi:GAF domain-containing protein/HAMP domain-containing protein